MNDGWYKVIKYDGTVFVTYVYRNMSAIGPVHSLIHYDRAIFEPVTILNDQELDKVRSKHEMGKSGSVQ